MKNRILITIWLERIITEKLGLTQKKQAQFWPEMRGINHPRLKLKFHYCLVIWVLCCFLMNQSNLIKIWSNTCLTRQQYVEVAQDGPGGAASCTFKQLALICWKRLGVNGNLMGLTMGWTIMNSQFMAKIWKEYGEIENDSKQPLTWSEDWCHMDLWVCVLLLWDVELMLSRARWWNSQESFAHHFPHSHF